VKGFSAMARICGVCGKGPQVANLVSHANNKVKRWVYPNVHKIRFTLANEPSKVLHDKVCTKCVKAKKIKKVI
jgi:large subunit ribosomal protein L28